MQNVQIHETAIIDQGAKIGQGTKIWHWVHVSRRAINGKNVTLGQNVYVGNNVSIGNNCKIQNHVSIFDNVHLEDDVFCGPSVAFTNVYNPRSFVERKGEFRDTIVKKGASLGANCTIICGLTIGSYSFVGAGSVVRQDLKPYALVVGVPARQIGWISQYGEKLDLPLEGDQKVTCPHTNQVYRLKGCQVERVQ